MSYGPPPSPGPDQPWGTPPPAMSPYQPPPSVPAKAPAVAWLVPVAAVLAIVGAATPWFKPKGTASGTSQGTLVGNSLYSWKDGRIGLLAPIVLVILAIGVIGLLMGRTPQRFSRGSRHPVVSAARGTIIAGVVSAVALVIAWFILPSQYKIDDGDGGKLSWDDAISRAKANGVNLSISRAPQIGFWLTIVAAVLAVVAGVLMLLATRNATTAPPPASFGAYVPQPPPGYPPPSPPPGYTQPGYTQPGYTQPGYTQPGYTQPGYTQPGYTQPGYNPPPPQQ